VKRLFGISLSCALIVSVTITGVGHASKPVRTINEPRDPFVIPAGFACPFDVHASPVGQGATTEFSDGRIVIVSNSDITLTNLEAPAETYVWRTNAYLTQTFLDDATLQIVVSGRVLNFFFPGEQGPFGVVGEDGAFFGSWAHSQPRST
jgi:hypothetical protein